MVDPLDVIGRYGNESSGKQRKACNAEGGHPILRAYEFAMMKGSDIEHNHQSNGTGGNNPSHRNRSLVAKQINGVGCPQEKAIYSETCPPITLSVKTR